MKTASSTAIWSIGMIFLSVAKLAAQPQSCRVVNLMPAFWSVVAKSSHATTAEEVRHFQKEVMRGDLYSASGFGFTSRSELDAAIPTAITEARSHSEEMHSITAQITSQLPMLVSNFRRTFPDFRCDFPIYLAPSLGKLDGAGRIINRRPALVIGIDQAAEEYSPATLPIFLTHELFHRYHQQAAGFSDDEGDQATIWRALWAEGLATYVSMKLTAGVTLQDALILPRDLIAQAQPRLPQLVTDVRSHLDEHNTKVFAEYFMYHRGETAVPSRSGYYIGALIAQKLNERFTLFELAHLPSSETEELERQALGSLLGVGAATR